MVGEELFAAILTFNSTPSPISLSQFSQYKFATFNFPIHNKMHGWICAEKRDNKGTHPKAASKERLSESHWLWNLDYIWAHATFRFYSFTAPKNKKKQMEDTWTLKNVPYCVQNKEILWQRESREQASDKCFGLSP